MKKMEDVNSKLEECKVLDVGESNPKYTLLKHELRYATHEVKTKK